MRKARKPKFDVEGWAASQQSARRHGTKCATCVRKDVREAIATIYAMRVAGQTMANDGDIATMLEQEFGFIVHPVSIGRHIKKCIIGKAKG